MANADARLLNAAADFVTAPASQVGIALLPQRRLRQYESNRRSKVVFAAARTSTLRQRRFASTVQIPKFLFVPQRLREPMEVGSRYPDLPGGVTLFPFHAPFAKVVR